LAEALPENSFSFNRDAFLNMTRTGSAHQNFGYLHCSTTTKTNTSPYQFNDIEKLAKFCMLALLSEPSTATRDERITISVPATIHQSPFFRHIRGHWWTMQQSQQVPPGDACLYISSCPNIIGRSMRYQSLLDECTALHRCRLHSPPGRLRIANESSGPSSNT
jgi:hypothetical protein